MIRLQTAKAKDRELLWNINQIRDLRKAGFGLQTGCSILTILLANILFRFISIKYIWIYVVLMIVLSMPVNKLLQKAAYRRLVRTKLVMRDRTRPFGL